jgi:predicted DNA-binding transcriptional regulator YafY
MGKAVNMLHMLMLLRSRGKMQAEELAKELGIKKRMVRKYKDDFEQLDIYIDSITGRYGGYYLSRDNTILNLGIAEEEFSVLKDAENYLSQESFIFLKEYQLILEKIKSNLESDSTNNTIDLIFESVPNVNVQQEKKKYIQIQEARSKFKKVELDYFSLSSGLKNRVVHPYTVYIYQGFWYLIAYCQLRNEVRQFKLSRIKRLEILDEEFIKPTEVSLKGHLEKLKSCVGIVYDKKKFKVKLQINYPMSIKVSERIWFEDQQITFQADNSILFEAEITGLDDLSNWVLSMGSSVKVIEPIELKNKVKAEAQKIIEKV